MQCNRCGAPANKIRPGGERERRCDKCYRPTPDEFRARTLKRIIELQTRKLKEFLAKIPEE